jgi:Holliday junction DNA helicase RuvA
MITALSGTLAHHEASQLVVQTDGGVGYLVNAPLGVMERLPPVGGRVTLFTELVVREDSWSLYGFDRVGGRTVFQRLLGASGFGPRLALALISSLGADRVVRSVRSRDLAALATVPGIGRKKAERLVLELQDKFDDVPLSSATPAPLGPAEEAVKALTGLGYAPAQADAAVRAAVANGVTGTAAVIRAALKSLTG